ncbi:hypothetical protein QR680_007404 [Steinernema hermaphroditum]|nr:hypothetical protein QR680_007404 [Steinernema hermaphroditum]
METVPYDFVRRVCSGAPIEQIQKMRELQSSQWAGEAASQMDKRRYFDVTVYLFHQYNAWFFERKYALYIQEIPKARHRRKLLRCTSFQRLKDLDQRYIRLSEVRFRFEGYRGGNFSTDFDQMLELITNPQWIDSNSTFYFKGVQKMKNNQDLVDLMTDERFLRFKRLVLITGHRELSHRILEFHVDFNFNATHIDVKDGLWSVLRDPPAVVMNRYITRDGCKHLFVQTASYLMEHIKMTQNRWMQDHSFQLELISAEEKVHDRYLKPCMHYYGRDIDGYEWYGVTHPENPKACAVAKWKRAEDRGTLFGVPMNDLLLRTSTTPTFFIRYCADKDDLPSDLKTVLQKECRNSGACPVCNPAKKAKNDKQ